MSIRQGLTASDEYKLKTLVSKGTTWEEIVSRCQLQDDRGRDQVPLFADVDLVTVKKNLYEPMVKRHEEARKANFKDIHAFEADIKKKRDAAAAAKKTAQKESE